MTTDDMLRAVQNIRKLNPAAVILTGGEPLFHDGIVALLEELIQHRIDTYIETNAMLVTDEILCTSRTGIEQGVTIHYAVSLDGGTRESHGWMRGKGSFDRTVDGLRRLHEANLPVDIQCVVNRRNLDTLDELVDLATELEVAYLKFVLSSPIGRANKFLDDLSIPFTEVNAALSRIEHAISRFDGRVLLKIPPAMIPPGLHAKFDSRVSAHNCTAATSARAKLSNVTSCSFPLLGVLPDGSITICAQTKEHSETYFGNIRDISLDDVWRAEQLERRRQSYLAAELSGICSDCIFKYECKGACRAHAYTDSGSFEGPYPICAEMDRQGHFPKAYRLSTHSALRKRWAASEKTQS